MEQYPFLHQPNGYELVSFAVYRQILSISRLTFIFIQQNEDVMENFDSRLSSSASQPLAARIYVVGSLRENPECLLKIANFSNIIDDPIEAIDIMFKIHLSMNLEFPRQSLLA